MISISKHLCVHRTGFAAEQIAKWIADRTEVQVSNSSFPILHRCTLTLF
jgi:hypothetical protein